MKQADAWRIAAGSAVKTLGRPLDALTQGSRATVRQGMRGLCDMDRGVLFMPTVPGLAPGVFIGGARRA
jgi:hypothetical protein